MFDLGCAELFSIDGYAGSTIEEKLVEDLFGYRHVNSRG